MSLFDRYVAFLQARPIGDDFYASLAACLIIAFKMRDTRALPFNTYSLTTYTSEKLSAQVEIARKEKEVLRALDFDIDRPNVIEFLLALDVNVDRDKQRQVLQAVKDYSLVTTKRASQIAYILRGGKDNECALEWAAMAPELYPPRRKRLDKMEQ